VDFFLRGYQKVKRSHWGGGRLGTFCQSRFKEKEGRNLSPIITPSNKESWERK